MKEWISKLTEMSKKSDQYELDMRSKMMTLAEQLESVLIKSKTISPIDFNRYSREVGAYIK